MEPGCHDAGTPAPEGPASLASAAALGLGLAEVAVPG